MVKEIVFKGSKLSYSVVGKGETMVFIHGYCEDSFIWKETAKKISAIYQVICVDLPGYGNSEMPVKHTLNFELFSESIYAILKTEKVYKATLIGHSMGGYTALNFAKNFPQHLSAIGLVNSHCFQDSEERKNNRKKAINFIQKRGTELFLKEFYPNLFAPSFASKNLQLIETLYNRGLKISTEAVVQTAQAFIDRKDTSATLKKTTVPVLMICGGMDNAVPKAYSLKMAAYPSFCDFHFFSSMGHMAMYEKRNKLSNILLRFLESTYTMK